MFESFRVYWHYPPSVKLQYVNNDVTQTQKTETVGVSYLVGLHWRPEAEVMARCGVHLLLQRLVLVPSGVGGWGQAGWVS